MSNRHVDKQWNYNKCASKMHTKLCTEQSHWSIKLAVVINDKIEGSKVTEREGCMDKAQYILVLHNKYKEHVKLLHTHGADKRRHW
eukprot:1684692-Heterocapsa_arctica.AAC.1